MPQTQSNVTDPKGVVDSRESDVADRLRSVLPGSLLALASIASVLTVLRRVVGGSRFQYYDYWAVLGASVSPNGSFNWGTLLLLQNEHPVATARLLYFLNARLFAGSNRSLGVIVVCLAVAQVLLVLSALQRVGSPRIFLTGAFAVALLFSPAGIHNFQLSMSGAAWLTANLFSILAIWLVLHDRIAWAAIAGLAASASYGTGLMVWPALVVLLALSGERRSIRHLPVAAGWVVSWVTYLFLYDRPAGHGGFGLDLSGIGFRALSVLGSSLSADPTIATLLGVAGIGLLTWLLAENEAELVRRSGLGAALCVYAIGAAVLIGFSRSEFGISVGVSSRYVSISAIFMVGLFVVALGRSKRWLPAAVAVGVLASVSGQGTLATYDRLQADSDEAAVAVRIGTGAQYFPSFDPVALPVVRAINHYPLNGDFDLACGMIGETIDGNAIVGEGIVGTVRLSDQQRDPALLRGEGTMRQVATGAQCVLAVSTSGVVVGAGALGFAPTGGSRRDGYIGFTVLAPLESLGATVVVVGDDGQFYAIDGELRAVEG